MGLKCNSYSRGLAVGGLDGLIGNAHDFHRAMGVARKVFCNATERVARTAGFAVRVFSVTIAVTLSCRYRAERTRTTKAVVRATSSRSRGDSG